MAKENKRLTPRKIALLWMLGISIVVGVLVAYEQISVLYLLATFGIVILLLIVGFSDLEELSRRTQEREGGR